MGDFPGASEVGRRVLDAVNSSISEGMVGDSCWGWVANVFKKAGLYPDGVPFYQSFVYIFRGSQYDATKTEKFLQTSLYSTVVAGDWLYIHNANQYDSNGNHSVIFIGWQDLNSGLATVASSRFANQPGQIETRNLIEQPIAFVMRAKG